MITDNKIGLKVKNRSYRYDINRPRPRQKLSRSFMKKLSNTEAELKKSVACKKKAYSVFFICKKAVNVLKNILILRSNKCSKFWFY